jgi:hypothetical protein
MSKSTVGTIRGLAIAAVLLASSVSAARAESTSATLRVSVMVEKRAVLSVEQQPSQLIVTEADVRRGYVEASSASKISIRSNSTEGYLVGFELTAGPVRQVDVAGLAAPAQIGPTGGTIAQPYSGSISNRAELSYRFQLAADAQPGTYAWPVSLSAVPR